MFRAGDYTLDSAAWEELRQRAERRSLILAVVDPRGNERGMALPPFPVGTKPFGPCGSLFEVVANPAAPARRCSWSWTPESRDPTN